MGELFTSPNECLLLVKERLTDSMRVRLSAIGGLSMGRELAVPFQFFAVRTDWCGPGNVSPVAHVPDLALDLTCYSFGIQE